VVRQERFGTRAAAGCLAAAALIMAGCSSSGGPTGGSRAPDTPAAALARLPSTGWDSGYVEFGDVAKVSGLNGAAGSGPLTTYLGVGESGLDGLGPDAGSTLGFDPLHATAAVTVGQPPHQVTVLYGSFDATAIGVRLKAHGFKQESSSDGAALWVYGSGAADQGPNPAELALLNVLDVSAGRLEFAQDTADLAALDASDRSPLSANAVLAALANCLGPAQAAMIGPSSPAPGSATVGIGLLATSAQDASEEVCVSAKDSATATSIGADWTRQITSGRSQRMAEPWSKLLVDPAASVVSDSPAVVRLTAKPAPGSRVGTLLQSYLAPQVDFDALISQ